MKLVIKKLIHIILFISISFVFTQSGKNLDPVYAYGKNFGSSDPPMFFIYHFITLDEKKIDVVSEPSGKIVTRVTDEGITNPQLLSTMITTAIGKWGQVKIAGESIQRRLGNENILDLMKNYDYPNETDYVVLGEINTLSNNYEIDLKIMDVSTQDIILSHFFQIQKSETEELRNTIEAEVSLFIYKLLKPFCGFVSIKVDDSSRDFLRWDYISIRPLKAQVGGKIIDTEEKDLRIVRVDRKKGLNELLNSYYPNLTSNDYLDYGIIWDEVFTTIPLGLLSGDYELVAFLKGNKDKFQTYFEVVPGQMTQIDIKIDYQPPPTPPKIPDPTGSLAISNLFEGVNFNLSMIIGDKVNKKVIASLINGKLGFNHKDESIGYKRNKSELLLTNLKLGTYTLGAYTASNETFPGKYYTLLYSFTDTIDIREKGGQYNLSLPDKKNKSGREIVIYLNPYPETKDEEYKLFLDKSNTPFSVVSNVGEVHIEGVAYDFSGNMIVRRDGYEPCSLPIKAGSEKLYLHADLSQSTNKKTGRYISGNNFKFKPYTNSKPPNTQKKIEKTTPPNQKEISINDKPKESQKSFTNVKPKKTKKSFSSVDVIQPSKIEMQFGLFMGFPGAMNAILNLSKNKFNLSATYGTDLNEMLGYELGVGISSVKIVMGNRGWENLDYSYKGLMINKKVKALFAEVGVVIGNDDVYDGPQLVIKLGFSN